MNIVKASIRFLYEEPTAVEKLKTAITNTGADIASVIAIAAAAISLIITSVAGALLLILCISTGWKARQGNEDAWGNAMQQILVIGAILCFSAAVNSMFF